MTASDKPLLQAAGLSLRRGRGDVVQDVTFTVSIGEVVAVVGPNGAGKSTLLAGLAGLLPPAAGSVERSGRIAIGLQAGALANRSALANVMAALDWWGVPRSERAARARAALALVGAEDLADRPASQLSGGQQRRVHLARAIALQADVLLLDEPFSNLDVESKSALLDDAAGILRQAARAVVVVVHERAEAWALADRVVVMLAGRVVADAPPRELLRRPPTPEAARFLGYTGELVDPDGTVRLVRPGDVQLDPSAELRGVVVRRVETEDGARLDVELPSGRVQVVVGHPGPVVGESVGVRITAAAAFSDRSAPADPMGSTTRRP